MINKKHIPCIAGSTGLVGSYLLKNLSKLYPKVISLTRKKVNYLTLILKMKLLILIILILKTS